jgi:hypothetical protein
MLVNQIHMYLIQERERDNLISPGDILELR